MDKLAKEASDERAKNQAMADELEAAKNATTGLESQLQERIQAMDDVAKQLEQCRGDVMSRDDEIKGRDARIGELVALLEERDQSIHVLNSQIQQCGGDVRSLKDLVALKVSELSGRDERIGGLVNLLEDRDQDLKRYQDLATANDMALKDRDDLIQDLVTDRSVRDQDIKNLRFQLEKSQAEIAELHAQIRYSQGQLDAADRNATLEIEGRERRIRDLQSQLDACNSSLASDIAERDARIRELQSQFSACNSNVSSEIAERDVRIRELQSQLDSCNSSRASDIAERDARIRDLQSQFAACNSNVASEIAERDARILELQSQFSACNSNVSSEIAERDVRIQDLQSQLDACNSSLASEIAERDARIRELQSQFSACNSNVASEIAGRDATIRELKTEIDDCKASFLTEVMGYKAQIRELQDQLDTSGTSATERDTQIADLSSQVEDLRTEHAQLLAETDMAMTREVSYYVSIIGYLCNALINNEEGAVDVARRVAIHAQQSFEQDVSECRESLPRSNTLEKEVQKHVNDLLANGVASDRDVFKAPSKFKEEHRPAFYSEVASRLLEKAISATEIPSVESPTFEGVTYPDAGAMDPQALRVLRQFSEKPQEAWGYVKEQRIPKFMEGTLGRAAYDLVVFYVDSLEEEVARLSELNTELSKNAVNQEDMDNMVELQEQNAMLQQELDNVKAQLGSSETIFVEHNELWCALRGVVVLTNYLTMRVDLGADPTNTDELTRLKTIGRFIRWCFDETDLGPVHSMSRSIIMALLHLNEHSFPLIMTRIFKALNKVAPKQNPPKNPGAYSMYQLLGSEVDTIVSKIQCSWNHPPQNARRTSSFQSSSTGWFSW